jgi:hypothetical protein
MLASWLALWGTTSSVEIVIMMLQRVVGLDRDDAEYHKRKATV